MQTKQIDDILAAINGKKFIKVMLLLRVVITDFTGGETLTIKNGAQGEKVSKTSGIHAEG